MRSVTEYDEKYDKFESELDQKEDGDPGDHGIVLPDTIFLQSERGRAFHVGRSGRSGDLVERHKE
jgi:hypothetical protein